VDTRLTSHHLEIMRRSLACGGLPPEQMAWVVAEATRLLDERDRARSLITDLVRPMADVRGVLNELHALFVAEPSLAPARGGRDTPSSRQVHRSSYD
jgi:hypothetical protein